MKTSSILGSLALSALIQVAAHGALHAQTSSPSPTPTFSPSKPVVEVTPTPSPSASPAATPAEPMKKKILEKYDLNHNGVLDPDEQAALDRDKAAKKAERLKKYDKNGDGKLDDAERAAMRADRENAKNGGKSSPTP